MLRVSTHRVPLRATYFQGAENEDYGFVYSGGTYTEINPPGSTGLGYEYQRVWCT